MDALSLNTEHLAEKARVPNILPHSHKVNGLVLLINLLRLTYVKLFSAGRVSDSVTRQQLGDNYWVTIANPTYLIVIILF